MKNEMTKIAWCHYTYNLWHGCHKVDISCKLCYAATMSKRWQRDIWGVDKPRLFQKPSYYQNPAKWQRKAAKLGVAYRVFVMSMGDIFEEHSNAGINARMNRFRALLWEQIEANPNLVFMLLTKRPENIHMLSPKRWLADEYSVKFPANVWLGTSIGTPRQLDRMNDISWHEAGGHFVSFEPLVERIDTYDIADDPVSVEVDNTWTFIAGGESGAGARKSELDWFYEIKEAAQETGANFFMKQYGAKLAKELGLQHGKGEDMSEWEPGLQVQDVPDYMFPWGEKK